MVSDVRFAVLMRLRRALEIMRLELLQDRRLHGEVILSRTEPDIAKTMCGRYRTRIVNEFPGCRILFAKQAIYIWLPDHYPNHTVPICDQLPVSLIECFTPSGLTKKVVNGD